MSLSNLRENDVALQAYMPIEGKIREAIVEEILPLRIAVLRGGRSEPSPHHDEDPLYGTFHLAFEQNNQIIGIASFHPVHHPKFPPNGYKLRGMAVLPEHQNKSIGKQILYSAEQKLKSQNIPYLWCNARQIAFPFYEKLGFHFISDCFDIPLIGPHRQMLKWL